MKGFSQSTCLPASIAAAIEAGKHVLCEKPFTDTAEQAREVYEAADRAGVFCQEGMWLRFFPAVEHARALLERGDIGPNISSFK